MKIFKLPINSLIFHFSFKFINLQNSFPFTNSAFESITRHSSMDIIEGRKLRFGMKNLLQFEHLFFVKRSD